MQPQTPRQNYIQGEVYTATPQKLQLLLIEAAMKNVYRTKMLWAEEKYDIAFESLSKAQDIVAEILCSLDIEGNPDLAKQIASIYVFIFRRLAEGGMSHNPEKLDDALRILASERETWRLVCEKFGSSKNETLKGDTAASQTPLSSAARNSSAKLDLSTPVASGAGNSSAALELSGSSPSKTSGKVANPIPAAPVNKPARPLPSITPTAPVRSLLDGVNTQSGKSLSDFGTTPAPGGATNFLNPETSNPGAFKLPPLPNTTNWNG